MGGSGAGGVSFFGASITLATTDFFSSVFSTVDATGRGMIFSSLIPMEPCVRGETTPGTGLLELFSHDRSVTAGGVGLLDSSLGLATVFFVSFSSRPTFLYESGACSGSGCFTLVVGHGEGSGVLVAGLSVLATVVGLAVSVFPQDCRHSLDFTVSLEATGLLSAISFEEGGTSAGIRATARLLSLASLSGDITTGPALISGLSLVR